MGSLSLLQGIFPTQGSNPGLPHCRQILYQLSHKGTPLYFIRPAQSWFLWISFQFLGAIWPGIFNNWKLLPYWFPSLRLGENRSCHRKDIEAYVLLVHYTTIIYFLHNKIPILKSYLTWLILMLINIKSSWLSHTQEKIIWRLAVSLVSDPKLILWVHMASMSWGEILAFFTGSKFTSLTMPLFSSQQTSRKAHLRVQVDCFSPQIEKVTHEKIPYDFLKVQAS